jgi:hypothetical protein
MEGGGGYHGVEWLDRQRPQLEIGGDDIGVWEVGQIAAGGFRQVRPQLHGGYAAAEAGELHGELARTRAYLKNAAVGVDLSDADQVAN